LCTYLTIAPESEEWSEELLLEALVICRNEDPHDEEAENDEDEILEIEEEAAIATTRKAIKYAEDMQQYFTATNDEEGMMTMGRSLCHLQDKLWKETPATKQSTLLDYFKP